MSDFTRQPLLKKLNNQNILSRMEAMERRSTATPSARVGALSEFSQDLGDARRGTMQVRADGASTVIRLNFIALFSTNVTPTLIIPPGALTGDNLLRVTLTGHLFQNTGVAQTLTPRAYLGKSGSETLITSDTALSMGSGQRRNFTFTITVSQDSWLGTNVKCNEEFILESATAGTPAIISRVTHTSIIDITNLNDVDSFFMRIANAATATAFRIFSDTLTVEVIDGIGTDQIHWWDQPTGTDGNDCYLASGAATTNTGSSTIIAVGEDNASVNVFRTLIKFSRISNIPSSAKIISVMLHLTIAADNATNARTLEAYRIVRDWTEAGATWNTYDGSNNWSTAGCGHSTNDYDGSVIWGSVAFAASELTGIVKGISLSPSEFQKWINGTYTNYGILLKMQTETNDAYQLHSAESATPDLAPILEVIYTL